MIKDKLRLCPVCKEWKENKNFCFHSGENWCPACHNKYKIQTRIEKRITTYMSQKDFIVIINKSNGYTDFSRYLQHFSTIGIETIIEPDMIQEAFKSLLKANKLIDLSGDYCDYYVFSLPGPYLFYYEFMKKNECIRLAEWLEKPQKPEQLSLESIRNDTSIPENLIPYYHQYLKNYSKLILNFFKEEKCLRGENKTEIAQTISEKLPNILKNVESSLNQLILSGELKFVDVAGFKHGVEIRLKNSYPTRHKATIDPKTSPKHNS